MLYPYIIIYHDITGWWFGTGFLWLSIGTLMIPTDELIFFQRDRSTSNQCCSTSLSNYIIVTLYICSNYTIIYDVHDHLIILSCYFRWPWLHLKHRTMFWKINGESPSWCRAMFDDCLVRLSQASVDISWHQLTSFKTLVSSHTCVLFMHSTAQPFLPNPGWDVERRGLSLQRGIIFMHSTYPQFYHVLSIFACAWPGFLCWPSSCVDHWSLRRPASPDAAWNRHDILTDGEITVKLTLSNVQIPPCGFCCI